MANIYDTNVLINLEKTKCLVSKKIDKELIGNRPYASLNCDVKQTDGEKYYPEIMEQDITIHANDLLRMGRISLTERRDVDDFLFLDNFEGAWNKLSDVPFSRRVSSYKKDASLLPLVEEGNTLITSDRALLNVCTKHFGPSKCKKPNIF